MAFDNGFFFFFIIATENMRLFPIRICTFFSTPNSDATTVYSPVQITKWGTNITAVLV